jgi:hypothetical protein
MQIERTIKELITNGENLIEEFNSIEKGDGAQRIILCNKWNMFWLLTEIIEKLKIIDKKQVNNYQRFIKILINQLITIASLLMLLIGVFIALIGVFILIIGFYIRDYSNEI